MTTHSRQGDEAREGVVLPSNGDRWTPGHGDSQVSPPAGQPWGQPWGPAAPSGQQGQPAPPPGGPAPQPQPPQYQPPSPPPQPPVAGAAPGTVPGAADETQLLPPMTPSGPAPHAPQAPQAPQAAPGAPGSPGAQGGRGGRESLDDATRVLRPVTGGTPPERDTERTTMLRRPLPPEGVPAASRPVPPPPAGAPYGIRPGAPGDRTTPPSDFDGLFRGGAQPGVQPGAQPADATQQLPPIDAGTAQPSYGGGHGGHGGHGGYGGPGGHGDGGRATGGRRGLPRAAVAGLVVAGLVTAGLAAGAALSGGDKPVEQPRAEAPAPAEPERSPSPSADPAEAQAKELDKLLADSNNSRNAVIRSVENIKKCENLGKAATDLRDAARQRNDLVTRLGEIEIDELPRHQELADALTNAWKASAAADNHYAAWADQVAGKKGCRKGQARITDRTAQGNKASGDATAAKKKAAGLWNPTARRYGLPERQFSQL
ncbi:hypothetical protein SUDANB106_02343 [Streptomyces sp. enrichment culture]|uniref:hypothetical protein n=1 Tax=Streptomyces sp. enrichment culture TaxID=1795815 RepID=UPI003F558662